MNQERIVLTPPKQIETFSNSLFDFCGTISKTLAEKPNSNIVLDFSKITFISGDLLAIFINFENTFERLSIILPESPRVLDVFKKLGVVPGGEFQRYKVCFKSVKPEEESQLDQYIFEELFPFLKTNFEAFTIEECSSIYEIIQNALHHPNSKLVTCSLQLYPKKRELIMTFVDIGETFGDVIRKNINPEILDDEAIHWATKQNNSTRDDVGGLGLYEFVEHIKKQKQTAYIWSGNGIFHLQNGKIFKNIIKNHFPGAIISFKLKL
ncbi:MAG: hypothetical protein ACRC3J_05835 [Culicoidibacterales bacterium]